VAILEEGAGGAGGFVVTDMAEPEVAVDLGCVGAATGRATETIGPTEMEQVLATVRFGGELLFEIGEGPRKVRGNDWRGGIAVRIDAREEAEGERGP
jgi:hypothetical protein